MKLSKYNSYLVIDEKGEKKYLVYNSISNGLGLIKEHEYNILKSNDISQLSKLDIIDDLIKGKFIYNEDIDELQLLEHTFNFMKYKNRGLGITILPTYNCNFKCPYCYETLTSRKISPSMSKETQGNLIKYVNDYIENEPIDRILVNWYGGEPLLELDTIVSLSNKLNELAKEKNKKIGHTMITNGYLLTEENIKILKELGIEMLQITIDGNRDIHDKRRILKNGDATFDTLMKNIEQASKHLKITLRTNVDKENVNSIEDYIEFVSKSSFKNNVSVYFAATSPFTSEGCTNIGSCYTNKEFSKVILDLYMKALKKGLQISYYPTYSPVPCSAITSNTIVVEPDGSLQKCWSTVGNKEYSLGNIKDVKNIDTKASKWLNFSPYKSEKCLKCKELPLCGGGCAYQSFESMDKQPICREFYYNFDELLSFNYLKNKVK